MKSAAFNFITARSKLLVEEKPIVACPSPLKVTVFVTEVPGIAVMISCSL